MEGSAFDISMIDPEMRGLVGDLRERGFSTFTSCQGTDGHAFDRPTVRMSFSGAREDYKARDARLGRERLRLAECLEGQGTRSS